MKIKKYTRVTAFFLAVCTVLLMLPLSVRADEYWPDGVKTQSKSAIVMEVNTGTVLYEKKSHEKHYPASITKIMTVLLAIENCDMDEVVTFSADAVFKNEGDTSHIARNLGEKLTMEQCLYAVMLESANECAYAVAEHVGQKLGGDYRTFIDRMNKRYVRVSRKELDDILPKDARFSKLEKLLLSASRPEGKAELSGKELGIPSLERAKVRLYDFSSKEFAMTPTEISDR